MRIATILLLFILLATSLSVVPHKALNLAAIDAHVLEIQKQAGNSKQIHKEMYDQSSDGGEMIAYLDNSNYPMLVTATFYGETGKITDSLYYWDKQLWFVKKVNSQYDKSIYWDNGKVNIVKQDAYTAYFRPNCMGYLFINGKAITDSVQLKEFEQDMFRSSRMLLDSCYIVP
ncbi:MAG: hypothetical protein JST49_09315 [Bacteroidetes bacterium]|nr:hypothetical protein [Bacteroidota bacterium]